ncbi:MAG: MBL fold metallo-hydrolase [Crocinitomicaceae bacterium]|nr:MBL fold metallo-hydrolase [Crocinitomicaceae bacterium]
MKTKIVKMTFNGFQENTFIVHDGASCVIVDPGCYSREEQQRLIGTIEDLNLTPVALLLTHGHIDHIMGVSFVLDTYDIEAYMHKTDIPTFNAGEQSAHVYGFSEFVVPPLPTKWVEHGDQLRFGEITLDVLFTPGHAPGHVVYYNKEDQYVINGDVLFQGSYGRYDLPGGSLEVLKKSITEVMFALPDETIVLCGHGGETTIGNEKKSNPILLS